MGSSMVKALKETTAIYAAGIDVREESIRRALVDHVIEEGAVRGVEEEKVQKILRESRFIVLGLYPGDILDFIREYQNCLQPGTIVMDICGLKGGLVESAQSLMPEGVEYISTHPMAGKEKSGYEYGDGELFLGASFIITPTAQNRPETIALIRRLAVAMGCGRIREISPQQHDEMIAYTSHLPHIMASTLIRSWIGTDDIAAYAGGSFRDATRVAEINTKLWTQLFCFNREPLLEQLKSYQEELTRFVQLLDAGDSQQLEAFLREASERKIAWNRGDRYDAGHN